MENIKPKNSGSARIFENPLLETLTRNHFWFPVSFYYLIAAGIMVYSVFTHAFASWVYVALFLCGMVAFSFLEYIVHRFVFHFTPQTEKQKKAMYIVHGLHHEFPRDKDRLVMPPVISIVLAAIFFAIFWGALGSFSLAFFPGFISGYSTYLLIHYAVHAYHPPNNFLKFLWTHHALHHYKDDHTAYAVSMPIWDHLFGTMPPNNQNKA